MASAKVEGPSSEIFRVRPEHNPTTKVAKYKRVHYLVCRLGLAVSDRLQEALIEIRQSANQAPNQELKQLALKGYSEAEFGAAVKEILCIWLHQEAIDQGGREAPGWILSLLRLTLGATDFLISSPKAMDVFAAYDECPDMRALCRQAAIRSCEHLGFGQQAPLFAAGVVGLLVYNRRERQKILQDALTLTLNGVERWQIA